MEKKEWHKRFKAQLVKRGVDKKFAQACLKAGMPDFDYDDSPKDAAEDEMSYWRTLG